MSLPKIINPTKPKQPIYAGPIKAPDIIDTTEGYKLFDMIAREALEGDRKLLETLTPYEQGMVFDWFADALVEGTAENTIHDVLWETDFIRKPVSIDQFIEDPYYFGRTCSDIDPPLREDLRQVFAPGSGVSEWILCLAGDTRIPLLDGTEHTLAELHAQWEANPRPFWLYSYDAATGQVVPGECNRVTKFKEDQLYKVTLDDGTSVRANADHEFVCRDGVKRKLRDLKPGDRLMPFTTSDKKMEKGRLTGYETVYMPGPQKNAYTHRMVGKMLAGGVCPKVIDGDRAVLHHKDLRKRNNDPSNLQWMGWTAHRELHRRLPKTIEHRAILSAMGKRRATDPKSPMRVGQKEFMRSARGRALALRNLSKVPVVTYEQACARMAKATASRWAKSEQHDAASLRMSERNKGNSYGRAHRRNDVSLSDLYSSVELRGTIQSGLASLNCSRNRAVRILADHGLTVQDLKTGYRNHSIVSIELDGIEPVYCLTVPAWGNFAIVTDDNRCGIFSGNTGSIGYGKTSIAMTGVGYKLYFLSCLRNPARYYGLLPGSKIVFGIYSITKKQVADTGYSKLRGMIDASEYFREKFPRNKKIDSKIQFRKQNIEVLAGSQEIHAVGLDLYAMTLDEANFMLMKKDKETRAQIGQAYTLYTATSTRIESRFMRPGGTIPGIMVVMSSRKAQTDFLEQRIKKVAKDRNPRGLRGRVGDRSYVSDYALWEVKPPDRYPSKEHPPFRVVIGDHTRKSEVLKPHETPPKDSETILIPGDFIRAFTEDPDAALRDIAGKATFNISPLIRDRQSLLDAIVPGLKHPFTVEKVTVGEKDDYTIEEVFDKKVALRHDGAWRPKINPTAPRYLHIDLSLKGDCAGIAMAHASGLVKHRQQQPDGTSTFITKPRVIVDFVLQIVPPRGSETDLSKIISFVLFLKQFYNILIVSFDGYQSAHSAQLLRKQMIESLILSVDRTDEPYVSLRAMLFDRFLSMYDYPIFRNEMLYLERDLNTGKVDHPEKFPDGSKGAKDCADAVCGALWWCLNDERAFKSAALLDGGDMIPQRTQPPAISVDPTDPAPEPKPTPPRRLERIETNAPVVKSPNGQAFDWDRLRENMRK